MKFKLTILQLVLFSTFLQGATNQRRITPAEVKVVTAAVEDEIYDYGYYGDFYQIGENIGTTRHWVARLHIYINPNYNVADGYGEVIYKLMPVGQIYRLFYLDEKGQVTLDGDPQVHFPMTQPSHQTVFMDDEEVCSREQTWIKSFFTVDTTPSAEAIMRAAERQKLRTGFSDWEYKHPTHSGTKP